MDYFLLYVLLLYFLIYIVGFFTGRIVEKKYYKNPLSKYFRKASRGKRRANRRFL